MHMAEILVAFDPFFPCVLLQLHPPSWSFAARSSREEKKD
jgi:hypothetical protein